MIHAHVTTAQEVPFGIQVACARYMAVIFLRITRKGEVWGVFRECKSGRSFSRAHGAGALIYRKRSASLLWRRFANYAGHLKMAAKNSDSDIV